jgi:predicted GIY-YIG superfamily endonuclease
MAIVYRHIRKDTNKVFYVGIGKKSNRAYSKHQRNKYWQSIVDKADYIVEIIKDGITWEEAIQFEIDLIKQYGRKDLGTGILSNMTDGGEGNNNQLCSIETRIKMGNTRRGRKHSEQTKQKISKMLKGKKHTPEAVEKNRQAHIGIRVSEETKAKLSKMFKGRSVSDDIREKVSKSNSQFQFEKYTLEGDYIDTYESMYLALKSVGKPATARHIYNCLNTSGRSCGFIWKKIIKNN